MKKQNRKKLISIVLTLCILFGILPFSVFAKPVDNTTAISNKEMNSIEKIMAGVSSVEEEYGTLDADTVPEIVGYENAVAKNHIKRLYSEEDELNEIVFLNADGTQTSYVYDYPVKYVDDNGEAKDITLDIASSDDIDGQFENATGSAVTTFSANADDGISLIGNNETLTLVPHIPSDITTQELSDNTVVNEKDNKVKNKIKENNKGNKKSNNKGKKSKAKRLDKKTISYNYDEKTNIEYSLTYTGFKEDIVVSEYNGQTEYDFTFYTNGLKLIEIEESFYLVDENNDIKAVLGDIIIFTADEKNNTMGRMVSETVVENEEYLLTIIVDPDFLADEKTAYPIRIDPTVEICYDSNGDGAISDVTLNSNSGSSGSSGSLSVGLRKTYGISRILMKFPGLNLSSLGNNIKITKAVVEIRDLMCETTPLDVYCYVFSGNVWNESTAKWSNVNPNSISTYLSSNTISYANGKKQASSHRYAFDITAAVEGWRTGNYNQNKGIIFKASSSVENGTTYNYKTIASYNRSSNKPSLSVTYSTTSNILSNGTYYMNNRYCGDYLRYASSNATATSGLISNLGNSIRWELKAVTGGYVIRSKSDTTKYLGVPADTSSNSVTIVNISDATIPKRCIWSISLASGGGCLVKNTYNSKYLYSWGNSIKTSSVVGTNGTPTYDSRVWRTVSTAYYGNLASYSTRELASGFNVTSENIDVGEKIVPKIIPAFSNALWISKDDFTYSTTYNGKVSISGSTIKGLTAGGITITATHKVTGLSKTFSVDIFSGTFRVYIFASKFSGSNVIEGSIAGHAWIQIDSHSVHDYVVGHYKLVSEQTMTVSKWKSNKSHPFGGVWYNREPYEYHVNEKYLNYVCSYVEIDKDDIDKISSIINSTYDDYDLVSDNCVHLSVKIWNACVDDDEKIKQSTTTPNGLDDLIRNMEFYYNNNSYDMLPIMTYGYYDGTNFIKY